MESLCQKKWKNAENQKKEKRERIAAQLFGCIADTEDKEPDVNNQSGGLTGSNVEIVSLCDQ